MSSASKKPSYRQNCALLIMENTNSAEPVSVYSARGKFEAGKRTYILQTTFEITSRNWSNGTMTGLPNTNDVHQTRENTENLPTINTCDKWSFMTILQPCRWQHDGSTTFPSMVVIQRCHQSLTFLSQNVSRMTAAFISTGVEMLCQDEGCVCAINKGSLRSAVEVVLITQIVRL